MEFDYSSSYIEDVVSHVHLYGGMTVDVVAVQPGILMTNHSYMLILTGLHTVHLNTILIQLNCLLSL